MHCDVAFFGEIGRCFPRASWRSSAYFGGMIENSTYSFGRNSDTSHLKVPLFSMRGHNPGPRIAVLAPEPLARKLSDRLWDLPSIGRMRGSLVVRQNDQDPAFDNPDITVRLTAIEVNDAYYHILGRMAELGMISGRGVPLRKVA